MQRNNYAGRYHHGHHNQFGGAPQQHNTYHGGPGYQANVANPNQQHFNPKFKHQQAPFEYQSFYSFNEMAQQQQQQQQQNPQYNRAPPQALSIREKAVKILEYKPRVNKNQNDNMQQKDMMGQHHQPQGHHHQQHRMPLYNNNVGGVHRNTIQTMQHPGGAVTAQTGLMQGGVHPAHYQQPQQQQPQMTMAAQNHHTKKIAHLQNFPFEMVLDNPEQPLSQFPSLDPMGSNSTMPASKLKDKMDITGYKTERNNMTKQTAESLTQGDGKEPSEKEKAAKQAQWEMHPCTKCGPEVDMIRKRVGICLNIMAKKDGIDKYDVSALTCNKCNLGFASKNKYIFYCEKCDFKMHPDGDCLLAEQYHARKRQQEKRRLAALQSDEAMAAGMAQDQDVPANSSSSKQQAAAGAVTTGPGTSIASTAMTAGQPGIQQEKALLADKLERENSDLKKQVQQLEEKMQGMSENYAESLAENGQTVAGLQEQIKQDENRYKKEIEAAKVDREKEIESLKNQIEHWNENHQNECIFKKKHMEDQKQMKNLTQKNSNLVDQVKELQAKNEKLANNGKELSDLRKQQKEERKKFNELAQQLKECQEKLDKQSRQNIKGSQDIEALHEEVNQRDQDIELLQLEHDKLELVQIQKEREMEQMRKELEKAFKELWVQREINDMSKSKQKDLQNDNSSKDALIVSLQEDQVKSLLQVQQYKTENSSMKRELVEMAQSIVSLPPGVVKDDRIVEVITDMAPRIIPTQEEIKKMECNFENLIPLLDLIFETFNMVDSSDLVLSIGNNGCGKSTLINSLMYGAQSLEEKQLEFQVRGLKGRMKKVKRTVIEQKDEFKSKNTFSIEHYERDDSALIPSFVKDNDQNIVYADVCGFNEQGINDFMDFISLFIDRYIFMRAEKIRFLVPIIHDSNNQKQYVAFKNQISGLFRLCQTNMTTMIECIQPVLTKCDIKDSSLNAQKIKSELKKLIEEEFESQQAMNKSQREQLEKENPELTVDDLKQFYIDLVNKLEIFDPMDRQPAKGQAIKRDDLQKNINELKTVPGGGIYAPFTPAQLHKFNNMVEQDYKLCEKKVLQMIQEAEEVGEEYKFDLRFERAFESLERSLSYLTEKHLLIDGERRLHEFYIYLKNSCRIIELAQLHGGLSPEGQQILKSMQKVNNFKNERDYPQLISQLFDLKDRLDQYLANHTLKDDQVEEAGPSEEDRNDIIVKQAIIMSQEVVQELAVDSSEILKFAYELRKQDTQDKYSFNLLSGHLRPPVLVDIILSNKWNQTDNKMTVDDQERYQLLCGDKYMRYLLKGQGQRQSLQLAQQENDQADSSAKFQLILTENGLLVKSATRPLLVQQHGMEEGGQFQLVQSAEGEQQHTVWNLIPIDYSGEEPIFCVEVPEGEKKPRIVSSSSGVGVMVTTRDQDGYFEQSMTAWKIVKAATA